MTTLFDAMLNLARRVRSVNTGSATSAGTTATLRDSNRDESGDTFNGHTLFVLSGSNANSTRRISDFVSSSGTITVDTVWSAATASGDRYLISQAVREDLVQAINAALSEVGDVTNVDTSLTVVTNQTEYTLASGVQNVVRVEVANGPTADCDYTAIRNWREINGKLYFTNGLDFNNGYAIRVFYNGVHDGVDADADTISDAIPIGLLSPLAAYHYQWQQFANSGNFSQKEDMLLAKLQNDVTNARARYRVRKLFREPIYGG